MLKPAFSLIELLVVVAIIGILAALGTVDYGNYIAQTKIKVVDTNRINLGSLIQTQIMTKWFNQIKSQFLIWSLKFFLLLQKYFVIDDKFLAIETG